MFINLEQISGKHISDNFWHNQPDQEHDTDRTEAEKTVSVLQAGC
jgi:hypothetical protein